MTNEEIINNYKNGESLIGLYRKSKITPQKIQKILVHAGLKIRNRSEAQRKYFINENFLDQVDSEWKAYFLGWMFSDGNVYIGSGRYTISLQLSERDKSILEVFNKFIYNDMKKLEFRAAKIKKTNKKRI